VPEVPTAVGEAVGGCADAVEGFGATAAIDAVVAPAVTGSPRFGAVVGAFEAVAAAEAAGCDAVVVWVKAVVVVFAVGCGELDSFSSASVETGRSFSSMRVTSAPFMDATRSASVVEAVGSSFIASTELCVAFAIFSAWSCG
jgi:hypothetical protein